MCVIVTNNQIDRKQWQKLVDNSHLATYFQTPECYDFYCSLSFMDAFVYGVTENNDLVGIVCGYIVAEGTPLKQYFSRRAIVPGGVLFASNITDDSLKQLLNYTSDLLSNKAIYIEIRNYNDYSASRVVFESADFKYNPHLNIQIDISDTISVFKNISESKRRQIKTAQKAGVIFEETINDEDVVSFYNCLEKLYKQKVKTPLFPIEFFRKLILLPNAKLLVVKHEGKVIGGMACVILTDKSLYEWFVCGDDAENIKYYPSVVATWAGINYAKNNGLSRFDFMGAGKPDEDYGVREFKGKFGGELVEHGRFLYICNPLRYRFGKFIISLIRKKY